MTTKFFNNRKLASAIILMAAFQFDSVHAKGFWGRIGGYLKSFIVKGSKKKPRQDPADVLEPESPPMIRQPSGSTTPKYSVDSSATQMGACNRPKNHRHISPSGFKRLDDGSKQDSPKPGCVPCPWKAAKAQYKKLFSRGRADAVNYMCRNEFGIPESDFWTQFCTFSADIASTRNYEVTVAKTREYFKDARVNYIKEIITKKYGNEGEGWDKEMDEFCKTIGFSSKCLLKKKIHNQIFNDKKLLTVPRVESKHYPESYTVFAQRCKIAVLKEALRIAKNVINRSNSCNRDAQWESYVSILEKQNERDHFEFAKNPVLELTVKDMIEYALVKYTCKIMSDKIADEGYVTPLDEMFAEYIPSCNALRETRDFLRLRLSEVSPDECVFEISESFLDFKL